MAHGTYRRQKSVLKGPSACHTPPTPASLPVEEFVEEGGRRRLFLGVFLQLLEEVEDVRLALQIQRGQACCVSWELLLY